MSNFLPESVKVARAGMSVALTLEGTPFPMHLGDNEVAILLSLYYWWYGALGAGSNNAGMGLWRKTDSDPPGGDLLTDHTDMLWNIIESVEFVTESVVASGKDHIIFPWPLVLIRPPRLMTWMQVFASLRVEVRLFYLIQEISDEELAKLMVKDHA